MNFILNFLTLGLLPLYRKFLGPPPKDPRREYELHVAWGSFGNPPEQKILKVLKKFFPDKELQYAFACIKYGACYVHDEDEGDDIVDALDGAGFNIQDSDVYELGDAVMYSGTHGGYIQVSKLNYCSSCDAWGRRLYRDFDGMYCSTCDSRNVINASDLSTKEFIKHAAKFSNRKPPSSGGNGKGSTKIFFDDLESGTSATTSRRSF